LNANEKNDDIQNEKRYFKLLNLIIV